MLSVNSEIAFLSNGQRYRETRRRQHDEEEEEEEEEEVMMDKAEKKTYCGCLSIAVVS